MMPKDWVACALSEITSWSSGGTPSKQNPNFWHGDIPWITAISMKGNEYYDSIYYISKEGLKTGSKLAPKNSILLLVRGSMLWNKIPIGITNVDLAFNQDVKCIQTKTNLLPRYLLYWFLSIENTLLHMVVGTGIGAGKLDTQLLQKLPIHFPSLKEQTKIIEILSTWDKAIITTEKLLANSEQQKKALVQQLLTVKKRFPWFCREWTNVHLSNISVIIMGTSPSSQAYNEKGIGLPLLQGNADILDRKSAPRVFTSAITKESAVGDVLLSVRAPVGTVAISRHRACIGRGIASIKANKDFNQEFLYQWLLWFEPKWGSLSQGSTFESISSGDIKNLNLLVPDLEEQQKIATVLSTADREIEKLKQKLNYLKQEKKALMQQLLTGKRRVTI